ncbi:MAG: pilus assembly protein PilM [Methylomonas sp.]|nr:pilus assembly protein PilM [Methylomonas sp.]PPD20713.1 MAG: pilus assembly protein PilM [Methylomonas sp.]PPD25049.1 MAG: pilus assembly protein PilM [Methylomonas sp.]PPD34364.1 MAG: pilus assembly protein PilM [Methylomonas sp.]PPD38963.1 MAG: pilus assembly protein PilM [Methylomonas sp.]
MSWFNKNQSAMLGIDISTAAVKLLELSRSGVRYKVESYAVAPLPQDAVIDKNIANVEVIGNAIKAAVKQSGTRARRACVAVAGSSVMTKIIAMPVSLSEDEMEEQIMVEADQYVPYSLDEVNLDFEVQGVSKANPDMLDVLLVASRRENIEDRVAALSHAGLKAAIVDVEAFAMENAFVLLADQLPDAVEKRTIAIVDVGATMTSLNVLYDSKTIYTRDQGFGGKQLTEEIQRRYGLSYEEAGLAKKHGGLPDNYIPDVLDPFKKAMLQQIARSLQFFVSSSANRGIDAMILAGGCASIPGLDKLVERDLGIPSYIANPFINMALSNRVKPQSLSNDTPAMMIACGLALRGFD